MENFFNIDDPSKGLFRQLGEGVSTVIHTGDHAMVSVVKLEPHAKGTLHHHPKEQWGICIRGSGIRTQGDQHVAVSAGDFWRTPSEVPHTIVAGSEGLLVVDVFAPPRQAYTKPGSGFASDD